MDSLDTGWENALNLVQMREVMKIRASVVHGASNVSMQTHGGGNGVVNIGSLVLIPGYLCTFLRSTGMPDSCTLTCVYRSLFLGI